MAIDVTCASCKTRFQVSDKFAGKQGPCPKCKKIITVPAKKDEVVIHAPEVSGPKDSKGQLVLKPIARKETRLTPVNIGVIAGSVVLLLIVSLVLRITYYKELHPPATTAVQTKGIPPATKEQPPAAGDKKSAAKTSDQTASAAVEIPSALQVLLALGAILLAPAAAFAGYTFLRNDELEPYRGRALILRMLIITAAYPLMWGIYWAIFGYFEVHFEGGGPPLMALAIVVPLLILAGAFASHATFDIEYGAALLHCCLYLIATVLLRLIIGLSPHWGTAWGT